MSTLRARSTLCVIAAVWSVFAACSGRGSPGASSASPTVRLGTFGSQLVVTALAAMQSAEPLVSLDFDGRPVFRLAESATASDDGRAISMMLRPNVKFHNGEPMTAAQVRELLLPKLRSAGQEVADIDVVGERGLVFRLVRPHAFKIADLSDYYVDHATKLELRTGPFKVAATEPLTTLTRNPDYYGGLPSVERIEIHRYANHRAAWTAMMRGEINFLHEVNRDAISFIEAGGDIDAYPMLRPFYLALVFNVRQPALQAREVRLAINEAIDREEVVANGMRGHGEPAEGPFWPQHWAYAPGRHAAAFNPEAARLRLDAAGLSMRRDATAQMPSRLRFACMLLEGDTRFERIALVIQRQLYAIGVDMELRPTPNVEFIERFKKGDFESVLFELGSRRALSTAYGFWHSKSALRLTPYAAADAALDRLRLAATEEDTRVAVSDVMRIMRDDPPAAFLAWPREARAADRTLTVPYEKDRDVLGNLWQVRFAPPQAAAR